jgi:hypothetical protein
LPPSIFLKIHFRPFSFSISNLLSFRQLPSYFSRVSLCRPYLWILATLVTTAHHFLPVLWIILSCWHWTRKIRDLCRTCVDLHGMLHHEGVPVEAMKALPLFRLQGIQGTAAWSQSMHHLNSSNVQDLSISKSLSIPLCQSFSTSFSFASHKLYGNCNHSSETNQPVLYSLKHWLKVTEHGSCHSIIAGSASLIRWWWSFNTHSCWDFHQSKGGDYWLGKDQ